MPLVLTHQRTPKYDDLPEVRYHFPKTYLKAAQSGVGEQFVYYEPRRVQGGRETAGGRQAYFAVGILRSIQPDPIQADHYYGMIEGYLEFDDAVPWQVSGRSFEAALTHPDGSTNLGAFQRAVRRISPDELKAILDVGFKQALPLLQQGAAVSEAPEIVEKPMVEQVTRRVFRDRKFREHVVAAYQGTCAMTGLRIVNMEGWPEVEAAHIQPAGGGANGPDSVRNGLALTRTVHWLFDNGFMSLEDDGTMLLSRRAIPDKVHRLLHEDRKVRMPADPASRPHPAFLRYHRTRFRG